jgi:GxxExxY protein
MSESRQSGLVEAELSAEIVGAFFDSYYKLGFGFLETVYSRALQCELEKRGLRVEREAAVTVLYDDRPIGRYKIDLLVEKRVVLEVKASELLPTWAHRQVLNYLRCSGHELGLVLHYGPKPRFHRVVNSRKH